MYKWGIYIWQLATPVVHSEATVVDMYRIKPEELYILS